MQCPICRADIKGEPCFEKKELYYKKDGCWCSRQAEVPASYYECSECGSSFLWVKGTGLREISIAVDARDLVDMFERNIFIEDIEDEDDQKAD